MDISDAAQTARAAWESLLNGAELEPMPQATNPLWRVTVGGSAAFVLKQLPEYPPGVAPADEFRVLCHLQSFGVPIALPMITDEGSIHADVAGRRWTLLPYLAHGPVCDDADTMYTVGAGIGLLDKALAHYPRSVHSFVDDPATVLDDALPMVPEAAELVNSVLDRLREATRNLGSQLTHGDCNAGNVLVARGRVTGIIDLDHLPTGPRVRDLAYYLASRINTDLPTTTLRVTGVAASCVAGYHSTNPLTRLELEAIAPLMLLVKIGGAHWALHGWDPDPESYRRNLAAIAWIATRLDTLNASVMRTCLSTPD